MFEGATEKAIESVENETATPAQADSGNQELAASQSEPQESKTPQEILDLQKVGKFRFEGQEVTYDELKKSYLRHQDYTKKTQGLAEERKFFDNLDADLLAVKKDPKLIAQFKQIYPEKFHRYLNLFEQAQAEGQSQAQTAQLPPEVREQLSKHEQMLSQYMNETQEATKESLGSMFSNLETDVQKKFPYADMVHVYGAVEDYLAQNSLTSKELLKNKAATSKMFETFAKASHEAQVKRFEGWNKEQLEKVRTVNQKAGDIGKGGGTPMGAPGKVRFKDVADQMIADITNH